MPVRAGTRGGTTGPVFGPEIFIFDIHFLLTGLSDLSILKITTNKCSIQGKEERLWREENRRPRYWHRPGGYGDRGIRLFDILRLPERTVLEFKQGHDLCRIDKAQLLHLLDAAEAAGGHI